ncbi:metalloregulator ArsR/SmtB family transcription factor [Paenibacillus aurantius]|uniref:Metalloregulator ArsR/SmtB family transcription factor n=1 Tax=Paenibacillus aurantius TaxID=2918900 RepID=A0AA96RHH1_9BACL|nr:metalloregulator ArsR/SmtB family transcription factor [Paenibacillus aurantius]WNQ14022.1 metalloregulator ArsR/SmtB family transcription factor [Paenibacillus aurantius]
MSAVAQTRDVYYAVADPSRRKIIRLLADSDELPLHRLTPHFTMGRAAVSKHLTILKEAGLVIERKVGRETRNRLTTAPLKELQDWLSYYEKFWKHNMARLDELLKEEQE